MELLSNTSFIAVFIAAVYALTKVVTFFVRKYGKNEQSELIHKIYNYCHSFNEKGTLTESQEEKLDDIKSILYHLNELNSIPGEKYLPEWYVPQQILTLLKRIYNNLQNTNTYIETLLESHNNKDENISELIEKQKDITENLENLLSLLSENLKKEK